ncbi:MAG TPA: hypothetical protein VGH29_04165 [Candidatus Binataceae bacterium]
MLSGEQRLCSSVGIHSRNRCYLRASDLKIRRFHARELNFRLHRPLSAPLRPSIVIVVTAVMTMMMVVVMMMVVIIAIVVIVLVAISAAIALPIADVAPMPEDVVVAPRAIPVVELRAGRGRAAGSPCQHRRRTPHPEPHRCQDGTKYHCQNPTSKGSFHTNSPGCGVYIWINTLASN